MRDEVINYTELPDAYKVIDGDNQIVLQMFEKKDTDNVLNYYKSLGKWGDRCW